MQNQRRLAGAVRTEESDPFAAVDVQVDVGERNGAVRVAIPQVTDLDHRSTHDSPLETSITVAANPTSSTAATH